MATKWYTTSQAAAIIGCHPRTARRWAAKEKLGLRIGRLIVLTAADVEALRGMVHSGPGDPSGGRNLKSYFSPKAAP